MKIDKITFKNKQAWVVIRSDNNKYLGTWHIVDTDFVKSLMKEMPQFIFFSTSEQSSDSADII